MGSLRAFICGSRFYSMKCLGIALFALAAVLLPFLSYITPDSPDPVIDKELCLVNLRELQEAKSRYAAQHGLRAGETVSLRDLHDSGLLLAYLVCPVLRQMPGSSRSSLEEVSYELGLVGEPPKCKVEPHIHVLAEPSSAGSN